MADMGECVEGCFSAQREEDIEGGEDGLSSGEMRVYRRWDRSPVFARQG